MKGRNSHMGSVVARFCIECGIQGYFFSPTSKVGKVERLYCENHAQLRAAVVLPEGQLE